MSANEYMESKLSNSKFKDQYDRKIIQQTFPERECFTLVMPVFDISQLKYLSEHSDNIRPEFTQGLLNLKNHIVNNVKIKEVISGQMFSSLI